MHRDGFQYIFKRLIIYINRLGNNSRLLKTQAENYWCYLKIIKIGLSVYEKRTLNTS